MNLANFISDVSALYVLVCTRSHKNSFMPPVSNLQRVMQSSFFPHNKLIFALLLGINFCFIASFTFKCLSESAWENNFLIRTWYMGREEMAELGHSRAYWQRLYTACPIRPQSNLTLFCDNFFINLFQIRILWGGE